MPTPTPEQIREVNVRYHDVAAADYDAKWGIDFDETGRQQVTGKLRKALGAEPGTFRRGVEIGAGTGYFGLNMLRAGLIAEYMATDISAGMLDTLAETSERLGLGAETACCDACRLPLEDGSVDLVFGHAVLHHLPDLDEAFAEFHRVLEPGGMVIFCGEPSRYGDRIASLPKRAALTAAPAWRALVRAGERRANGHGPDAGEHDLEKFVDVHAFGPRELAAYARGAGFRDVRVRGEELTANWFGWFNRTCESTAEPSEVPWLWRQYAYRGYLAFQAVDRALLEPRLPAALFYNLLVAARKPPCG